MTKIELTEVFDRWCLLNLRDFKTHLLAEVNDWIQVLKDHLKGQVMARLAFLEQFIDRGNAILCITITNDDYENLLKVMEVLAEIKDKRTKFNEFFQPLLNIVELLKIYGEEFSQEMYSKVSESLWLIAVIYDYVVWSPLVNLLAGRMDPFKALGRPSEAANNAN